MVRRRKSLQPVNPQAKTIASHGANCFTWNLFLALHQALARSFTFRRRFAVSAGLESLFALPGLGQGNSHGLLLRLATLDLSLDVFRDYLFGTTLF
jgi:hypothetical protein